MNTHADKTQENTNAPVANCVSKRQSSHDSTFQFVDNRPEAIAQRELQEIANNSPHVKQLMAFQKMANNGSQAKQAAQLQAMADNYAMQQLHPIQKKASPEPGRRENNTGLPDNLKSGIENLSGYSMDDVKVHRNSDKPAQLQAHAYAQGTDIHLGPGQEKHLPHEAWHVAQQRQGRVKPTLQMKGNVNVNDDVGLENEADVMGMKGMKASLFSPNQTQTLQRISKESSQTIQMNNELLKQMAAELGVAATFAAISAALYINESYLKASLAMVPTLGLSIHALLSYLRGSDESSGGGEELGGQVEAGRVPILVRKKGREKVGFTIKGLIDCVGVVIKIYEPDGGVNFIAAVGGHFETPTMYDAANGTLTASGQDFIRQIRDLVAQYDQGDLEMDLHIKVTAVEGSTSDAGREAEQAAQAIIGELGIGGTIHKGGNVNVII